MSVESEEVQRRFRAVAKRFPLWRLGFDMLFDTSSWRLIGADITTLVVQSKNVRHAANEMTDASPQTLDAMAMLARINEQRPNDLFRAVFLGYVSIPVAMAALLSDAAPDFLERLRSGVFRWDRDPAYRLTWVSDPVFRRQLAGQANRLGDRALSSRRNRAVA